MTIALASDHAGFKYKADIKQFLEDKGYKVTDHGCENKESCDYPDFAVPAAMDVAAGKADYGVIICGSGIGMSIVSNKVEGVRAANCCTVEMARLARQHNNANVLTFGERLVDSKTARDMAEAFLSTEFEGGRHERRVKKIHDLTRK